MRDAAPGKIFLKDYKPFGYLVDFVHLTFDLSPHATRVTTKIGFRPNPEAEDKTFFLHGEHLKFISATIDGMPVTPLITAEGLTCHVPPHDFVWETVVEIDPANNTALEGLYMSKGMYSTQCEAEGFRKITFYPDRPDVMSVFTVRINGDLPVLLSNGNKVATGPGFAEWHDPWPKPAYLFALVAGELINHPGRFTTKSGRDVELNIWVRPGDEDKCAFAMEALRKSMKWDEDVYGREYDLDIFNIVAVDDFNMGAMENKGLNIFNSSAVLASPETATDLNFERIEAIIAHEYFHNWTGNRITCRDWFQLCLKEGLTVFRDSQFTSDMRSAPVKRIADVIDLRGRQFPEDAGPLAHPVRPESYEEINNFYTATVYEKGAEVIGMLKRLVGDDGYARALDLYFDRHDGQACTIEDWLTVFQDATGRDLSQFKRWYSQAGTPRLTVEESWEGDRYTLTFTQETRPTPHSPDPKPQVIPIAVGLLGPNGDEIQPTTLLEMTDATQSFTFDGIPSKPVPSILRGFSAPVALDRKVSREERAFLLAHDTDPFNRWEAGRALAREILTEGARTGAPLDGDFAEGLRNVLRDDSLDPAYRALMLALPGQSEIAAALHAAGTVPDPMAIWTASETLKDQIARLAEAELATLYEEMQVREPYAPNADQAGRRALRNAALAFLNRRDGAMRARAQYSAADNMTMQLAALGCLLAAGNGVSELEDFYDQWQGERLVLDKWFAIQVMQADPWGAVPTTARLTQHSDFMWQNPNRFRAVFGSLAGNHAGFHAADGAGYRLLADWLIRLDAVNPQTAARMCAAFQTWRHYDAGRQLNARAELERIAATPDLSRDMTEMVGRMLS
ncbi:aminopeptidase N [Chachezhania sediminis]|uniref:aminopeptidase N n=1 Tax=Chachezhania sediminis TaxID=2599291 RepID=UPI00131E5F3F|nr:aminopeptidase N [Chachezhania sediminis]